MSASKRRLVLALLIGLHAAAAVLLAPVDFLQPESFSGYVRFAVFGALMTPPALLAFCAALGPWPGAIRAPLTTWFASVFGLLLAYGAWRGDFGYGMASDPGELAALCFIPLVEFSVLLAPLALLRGVRRWRLEGSFGELAQAPRRISGQYTIRSLLVWTLAAAAVVASLRRLLLTQDLPTDEFSGLLRAAAAEGVLAGIMMGVAALPALSVAWLVLLLGKRLVLRASLIVVTAGGIAAVLAVYWQMDHDVAMLLLAGSIETGVMLASLASVIVLRGCGYRLVRWPPGEAEAPQVVAADTARPQRQFAWMLGCLTAATIALASCAPSRLSVWKQATETRYWAERGLELIYDGQGRMRGINGDADGVTDDELHRFAEMPDLARIDFTSLRDSQIAALTAPASLDTLCITDSRFTDKGLEHIGRFPQLRELGLSRTSVSDAGMARIAGLKQLTSLRLSLTDVSDEGLTVLAECKQLRWIDLSLTSVTAAGARRLSEALPDAKITIGACDAVVRAAVLDYGGDVRLERLHACGKVQTFGSPPSPSAAVGLSVTDAGLKLLNTHMQLKTLDLRYAAITDGGLPALFPLKTLEQIDLRDTGVTETGRQQLAKALPDCEILR